MRNIKLRPIYVYKKTRIAASKVKMGDIISMGKSHKEDIQNPNDLYHVIEKPKSYETKNEVMFMVDILHLKDLKKQP